MYGTQTYPGQPYPGQKYSGQTQPGRAFGSQPYPGQVYSAAEYPQDIRPLITRHRLRRQRRRKAATLLTGASIALGVAALRSPSASAHSPAAQTPVTRAHPDPGVPQNLAPG